MLDDVFAENIIDLTQFMYPDGRAVKRQLEVSKECFEAWELLTADGFFIECEWLPTGHVSATITDPEMGDYAIIICGDGDTTVAQQHLEDMIKKYDSVAAKQ